ncbi:MAG: hypothetical protein ACTJHE_16235 [Vibrio casei]
MKRLFTILLPLLSVSANAANAEFIDFAVKQAVSLREDSVHRY